MRDQPASSLVSATQAQLAQRLATLDGISVDNLKLQIVRLEHVNEEKNASLIKANKLNKQLRDKNETLAVDHFDQSITQSFQSIAIKMDATSQEIVDREKLHVALVRSISFGLGDVRSSYHSDSGRFVLGNLESRTARQKICSDLMEVARGTSAELYVLVEKELERIGCSTWTSPSGRGGGDAGAQISLFSWSVDAGSENGSCLERAARDLVDTPNAMLTAVYCMMHQGHLIAKHLVEVLEKWDCFEDGCGVTEEATGLTCFRVKYFSSLSAFSNYWRGVGRHKLIEKAVQAEYERDGGHRGIQMRFFNTIPGRCLRGRWLSLESVEEMLVRAAAYLPRVFKALGILTSNSKTAKASGPGAEEANDWAEKQRSWRLHVVNLGQNPLRLATMRISLITKGPIAHFLRWIEKANRDYNDNVRERSGYLGPTPPSQLVSEGGADIRASMSLLPRSPHLFDEVFIGLPDRIRARCRLLVVAMVLASLASWDFRVGCELQSFPLLLLRMLESGPDVRDDTRAAVAAAFLGKSAEEPKAIEASDVQWKNRVLFRAELDSVAEYDTCLDNLYGFLLAWRSGLDTDTQEAEGINGVLQAMGRAANHLERALCSDWLRVKKSDRISPDECVIWHKAAMKHMNMPEHLNRFAVVNRDVTPGHTFETYYEDVHLAARAAQFQLGMARRIDVDVGVVWFFVRVTAANACAGYFVCWSYYRNQFAAVASIETIAPIGGLGGDDGSDDDDDMSFAEFLEMLIEEDRGHADDDAVAVDADRADRAADDAHPADRDEDELERRDDVGGDDGNLRALEFVHDAAVFIEAMRSTNYDELSASVARCLPGDAISINGISLIEYDSVVMLVRWTSAAGSWPDAQWRLVMQLSENVKAHNGPFDVDAMPLFRNTCAVCDVARGHFEGSYPAPPALGEMFLGITPLVPRDSPSSSLDSEYEHISERLGPKLDVEYFEWANEHFLISDDYHLSLLRSAGAFAVERHSEDKEGRGSKASVTELAKSVWAKGIRQEMGGPPWLVQSASVGDDETFTALHWGALLTATKDCMLRDVDKTNARVQDSLKKKIKGCRLYSRRISKGAARSLACYGNGLNEAATPTTSIQVYGYTSDVQTSFGSRKAAMKWTNASIGAAAMKEEKLKVAHQVYPLYWKDATALERCPVMYKDSQKIMIDVGERFRYEVAANKMPSTSFDRVFHCAADVVRILKDDHPEYIPDLVLLCMPRLLGNWGACPMLPDGLPIFKSTDVKAIAGLLNPLPADDDTSQPKPVAPNPMKRAKKTVDPRQQRKRRKVSASVEVLGQDERCEEQIVEQGEKEAMAAARAKSFLSYLTEVCKPLARIDETQLHLVGGFKAIALHGALFGSVKLRVKGGNYKTVKGPEGLHAAFITHMTKRALAPRYSDPMTDSCAEEAADVDGGFVMTEEDVALGIDENKQTVEQIVNHLFTDACITKPMAANLSAASALNQVMMASFKIQADQGGSFAAGGDDVQLKFFDIVIESVLDKYPDSWDAVATCIAKAKPQFSACLKETATTSRATRMRGT
ncbi:unnamed protein product [Prorocentrum cordatum]|uniref:Non-specific serine/threonine protein kinase n=1 Tax=Prorocentrum cordatum TaxID=2364126 RepID=A0ABN9VP71_9DINO|nr:unnamed protein product [Polarella glacialis]